MIETTIDWGAKVIKLESTITAHDFYKHMGFVDHGPERQIKIGGQRVTCFPMIMKL